MSLEPLPARERFISLDILRGIALLGVVIGNSALYSGRAFAGEPPNPTALDSIAQYIGEIFVESKAQTLLCMLFGFGFAMQLLRAERRGEPVMGIYIRRLVVLFAIGWAHVMPESELGAAMDRIVQVIDNPSHAHLAWEHARFALIWNAQIWSWYFFWIVGRFLLGYIVGRRRWFERDGADHLPAFRKLWRWLVYLKRPAMR